MITTPWRRGSKAKVPSVGEWGGGEGGEGYFLELHNTREKTNQSCFKKRCTCSTSTRIVFFKRF